jgi:hypothetical protein
VAVGLGAQGWDGGVDGGEGVVFACIHSGMLALNIPFEHLKIENYYEPSNITAASFPFPVFMK